MWLYFPDKLAEILIENPLFEKCCLSFLTASPKIILSHSTQIYLNILIYIRNSNSIFHLRWSWIIFVKNNEPKTFPHGVLLPLKVTFTKSSNYTQYEGISHFCHWDSKKSQKHGVQSHREYKGSNHQPLKK